MNQAHTTVPCPNCKTPIPIDVKALLNGAKFTCPGCGTELNASLNQSGPDPLKELLKKIKGNSDGQ